MKGATGATNTSPSVGSATLRRTYNPTMPATNNVLRILQARRIRFAAFDLPNEKLGALEAARLLKTDPGLVYKTIVLVADKAGKPLLAVVPGTSVVDPKKVAVAIGEKKVHIATERQAEELTGLQAGGISPLALLNRGFRVLIDESALRLTEFHISGGQRGLNIRMSVEDLARITGARFASISAPDPAVDNAGQGPHIEPVTP